MKSRKGMLAWEYIAIIILGLIVVLIVILFTTTLKDKIIDAIKTFGERILGR